MLEVEVHVQTISAPSSAPLAISQNRTGARQDSTTTGEGLEEALLMKGFWQTLRCWRLYSP